MHLRQKEKYNEEDRSGTHYLFLDGWEGEQQPFHKIGKRDEERKIKHHAVDHIITRFLHIGVRTGFISPSGAGQLERLLIIFLRESSLCLIQMFVGKLMKLIEPIAADAEPFIQTCPVLIEPPHVTDNNVRCYANAPVFTHNKSFSGIKRWILRSTLARFNQQ